MEDARLPRLPLEVFLCIITVINDSRVSFKHAAYYDSGPDPSNDAVNSLKTLSITHRSLTGPAQRALGSRLSAASLGRISGLLQSPLLGTSTHELSLKLTATVQAVSGHGYDEEMDGEGEHSALPLEPPRRLREIVDLSLELIKRAPSLRSLRVMCPLFASEGDLAETLRFLQGIVENAKALRHLCWTGPEYAEDRERLCIEEIWRSLALARRSLDVLSLRNVELRAANEDGLSEGESELDDGIVRGGLQGLEGTGEEDSNLGLTSLTIMKVGASAFPTPRFSACLARLFGHGTLRTLTLDLTSETSSPTYTAELIRTLGESSLSSSSWSALTHLRLRIGAGPIRTSTSSTTAHLSAFFGASPSLTHLQIWVGRARRMMLSSDSASAHVSGAMRTELSRIFLPTAVASVNTFVPILLSCAAENCLSLTTLHLGFFHIAGPFGAHRWGILDEGISRGLAVGFLQSRTDGMRGGLRELLINMYGDEFDFPCLRRTCAEAGSDCVVEVRREFAYRLKCDVLFRAFRCDK
ncbi:hypothetical protein SCHPADRAFT_566958 [Schizopora paradoxa]|uniref:Uncharacterized protein n=1 Tax=Schizopora paradoxa TaxID=27342 RepID=A0A0H2RC34_9AGAM|nr:hypothetical protein SCHPADRAFT_566958 [Schizopora paradoxa]